MSEAEFNLLLDAVRDAMDYQDLAPAPEEGFVPRSWTYYAMAKSEVSKAAMSRATIAKAANDNEGAWPLLPFPDGWYAAC